MTENFVVFIDNGQGYSDHKHRAVASCETEADAIALKKLIDDWLAARPKDDDGYTSCYDVEPWAVDHPWPLGGELPYEATNADANTWYVKVPQWAKDRP